MDASENPNTFDSPSAPHVPDAEDADLRDELVRTARPRSAIERALVEQRHEAATSARRCRRVRTNLEREALRQADRDWRRTEEDDVEHFRRMLPVDARSAVLGLSRFAAGARYLV